MIKRLIEKLKILRLYFVSNRFDVEKFMAIFWFTLIIGYTLYCVFIK